MLVHEVKHAVTRAQTPFVPGRDVWWGDAVPGQAAEAEVEWVESDHPLFLLYTSGSTGEGACGLVSEGEAMVDTAGGRGRGGVGGGGPPPVPALHVRLHG